MKNILIACILGLCFLLITGRVYAQNDLDSDGLRNMKITLKAEKRSLGWVLGALMVQYDVPIGFENSLLDDGDAVLLFNPNKPYRSELFPLPDAVSWGTTERLFSLSFVDQPLPVVLDEITRQLKHYRWEIQDGVVNFTPTQQRSKIYQGLLDIKISKFKAKYRKILFIRDQVLELEEVGQFLKEVNAKMITNHPHQRNALRLLSTELEFPELTLRELLNKITKVKRGGWLLRGDFDPNTPKTGIHWVLLEF